MKNIVTWITIIALFLQAPCLMCVSAATHDTAVPARHARLSDFATVLDTFTPQNSRYDKKLTVIYDAHDNLSAQLNIASVLDLMSSTDDLYCVYLEGASGDIKANMFQVFDDTDINDSTASFLLKNGFIKGAEYFQMTSSVDIPLKGAEVSEDYYRNLDTLRALRTDANESFLRFLIDQTNSSIRNNLSEKALHIDQLYEQVLLEGCDVSEFITALRDYYTLDISSDKHNHTVLSKLIGLQKQSETVERIAKENLVSLMKTTSDGDLAERIRNINRNLILVGDTSSFLHDARDILNNYMPDDNNIAQIDGYCKDMDFLETMPSEALYLDIVRSYKKLFSENIDMRNLFAARDMVYGLHKGLNIRLTSAEVAYFDLASSDVTELLRLSLPQTDYFKNTDLSALTDNFSALDQLRVYISDFYTFVEQRNNSIFSTINTGLPAGKTAVLIIGGYHKSLCEKFKENGYSIMEIAPNLETQSEFNRDTDYVDHLSGSFSSLEKMFYYLWSTIVSPILSQAIDQYPDRKTALPPFIARQLSMVVGASLTIQDSSAQVADKDQLIENINTLYDQDNPLDHQMIESFLGLSGNENIPKMPRVNDFVPIANNNGFFISFQVGTRTMLVQLLKDGHELSSDEAAVMDSLKSKKSQTTIKYKGEPYTLTVTYVPQGVVTRIVSSLSKKVSSKMLAVFVAGMLGLTVATTLMAAEPSQTPQKPVAAATISSTQAQRELATLARKYTATADLLDGWLDKQGTRAGSNKQVGTSFRNLWQSYQYTNNYASHYLAGAGRVWPYDSSLGLYAALAEKDYDRASKAVDNFIALMRAEKAKGYRGLYHFSYNTLGDDYIDPKEPMGSTLWVLKALYTYMLETGDMRYYEELTEHVRNDILTLQIINPDHPAYGYIRAGYTHPDGSLQGGSGIYLDIDKLNTVNEQAFSEHLSDFIDLLRIMTHLADNRKPRSADTAFRNELRDRHALAMQAAKRVRQGVYFPTAFDEVGDPNYSRAVDHYTWLSGSFMDVDEDLVWESIQVLKKDFTCQINSFTILEGKAPKMVKLPKPIKGLFFFAKDFSDPYVTIPFKDKYKLVNMIQPEATAGAIVVLSDFIRNTDNPTRRKIALDYLRELLDGLATLHQAYAKVYPGNGMPYATVDIDGYFNSTPAMAATASYYVALQALDGDFPYFLSVPLPNSFSNPLTRNVNPKNLPSFDGTAAQVKREKPVNISPPDVVEPKPLLQNNDMISRDITFNKISVINGMLHIKLSMPDTMRNKYKIVICKKTDMYYIQPTSFFHRDYKIGNGEFVLRTFRPDLDAQTTVVLVVDPEKVQWKFNEALSEQAIQLAIQDGGVVETIAAQARLSRDEIARMETFHELMDQAGILPEDRVALLELTDRQRIVGDFDKLEVFSQIAGQDFHETLLRAYARELGHMLVANQGLDDVTRRFIEQVSRERFDQMRQQVGYFWDMEFRDDNHFMDELIDFYMDSVFSGENRGFFSDDLFEGLWFDIKKAVGADLFDLLYFIPSLDVPGSAQYRMDQVHHVEKIADRATALGIDTQIFKKGTVDNVLTANPLPEIRQTIQTRQTVEQSL